MLQFCLSKCSADVPRDPTPQQRLRPHRPWRFLHSPPPPWPSTRPWCSLTRRQGDRAPEVMRAAWVLAGTLQLNGNLCGSCTWTGLFSKYVCTGDPSGNETCGARYRRTCGTLLLRQPRCVRCSLGAMGWSGSIHGTGIDGATAIASDV